MSYFLFGPNAESWAIGNIRWNAYQNLPSTFANFFENQTLNARTINWFSTGPNGLCCFLKKDNTFIQSQIPNLVTDTSPSNVYGLTIQQVDHLSFSPEGGWFVRYNDGTVRLSMVGGFHENFHTIAQEYMQTRGSAGSSRQRSRLKWVFFGADGAVISVLDNGDLRWIGITEELVTSIRTELRLGWSLAKQTTLCQWDKTYYYLKWTRNYGLEEQSLWNIKPTGIITPLLLREVAEGRIPVSHTVQAPKATPTPAKVPYALNDGQAPLDLSSLNISSSSQPSLPLRSTPGLPPKAPTSKPEKEDNDYDKELSSSLDSAIVTESPNVHWDDIAGLDQAKEELNEAVILPIRYPQLFTGKRKARKGILLFGPPGTGKSYLAKACATEIQCTFFSISCSDIMSKWLGESERLIKTLFKKAREHKPSIIFIDEIEAMGGTRDDGGGENKHLSGLKTEFLVQMDGVGNDVNGVLVLAATNLPWKLDPALRRRFQRRIHIGLPDTKARTKMFEIGVGDTPCDLNPKDYEKMGEMTKGFSGSDISGVTQDALMVPVKKITAAKHFREVMQNHVKMFIPCASYDLGAMPMRLAQVPPDKLLEPPLTSEDFFGVIEKSRPSVASDELPKYTKWTEDFGSEGA